MLLYNSFCIISNLNAMIFEDFRALAQKMLANMDFV